MSKNKAVKAFAAVMLPRKERYESLVAGLSAADLSRVGRQLEKTMRDLLVGNAALRESIFPEGYEAWASPDNPTAMLCDVVTEADFYVLGGFMSYKKGLTPMIAPDPHIYNPPQPKPIHRFLLLKATNDIIDPTSEQYTSRGLTPPYEPAKYLGFTTNGFPERRARILIHEFAQFLESAGAEYKQLRQLARATADWYPAKEQQKELGVNFRNRPAPAR